MDEYICPSCGTEIPCRPGNCPCCGFEIHHDQIDAFVKKREEENRKISEKVRNEEMKRKAAEETQRRLQAEKARQLEIERNYEKKRLEIEKAERDKLKLKILKNEKDYDKELSFSRKFKKIRKSVSYIGLSVCLASLILCSVLGIFKTAGCQSGLNSATTEFNNAVERTLAITVHKAGAAIENLSNERKDGIDYLRRNSFIWSMLEGGKNESN
jgi:Fe-S cluster assembly scaffold protein SufB